MVTRTTELLKDLEHFKNQNRDSDENIRAYLNGQLRGRLDVLKERELNTLNELAFLKKTEHNINDLINLDTSITSELENIDTPFWGRIDLLNDRLASIQEEIKLIEEKI